MDFIDGCKDLVSMVTSKILFAEAKILYRKREVEKAKKKLLSADSLELSFNAEASYLLAKIYLETLGNYTSTSYIKDVHNEIILHLKDAMKRNHKKARELYNQYCGEYGSLKAQEADILEVLEKYACKENLYRAKNLDKHDLERFISRNRLEISIYDEVLYGKIDKVYDNTSPKWLLTRKKFFYIRDLFKFEFDYNDIKYAFERDRGVLIVCNKKDDFNTKYFSNSDSEYVSGIVDLINNISLAVNDVDYVSTMLKCEKGDLRGALYSEYYFNNETLPGLWMAINNLGFEATIKTPKDVLGARSFDKDNTNIIVFTDKFVVYVLGKNKTVIDYSTLKNVTFDSKTFTVHRLDGSRQTFEHSNIGTFRIANTLNRFAIIVNKKALLTDGRTMITHENVDFHFIKFNSDASIPKDMESLEKMYLGYNSMPIDDPYLRGEGKEKVRRYYECELDKRNPAYITHDNVDYKFKKYVWGNVPKSFEELEKMYLGYTSMPEDHIEQIGKIEMGEIKDHLIRADLQDKYLQMQADAGLVSAQSKLFAKHLTSYRNLSSIVSEIWYRIICDYENKVSRVCSDEIRYDNGNEITNKVFWFEIVMEALKEKAVKQIINGEKPVFWAAYEAFNPTYMQLNISKFRFYEHRPISEILGKAPTAVEVMKLFNVSTHAFYTALRNDFPNAWLYHSSFADMQKKTVETEYLPLSSMLDDYSLQDLKEIADAKRYFKSQLRTEGRFDSNYPSLDKWSQFEEDRRIENVTFGEPYSSYKHKAYEKHKMSFINYKIKNQNARQYMGSYVMMQRDQKYLSFYEEMSDAGSLLFTCFICENGETDSSDTPVEFFQRRDKQYAELSEKLNKISFKETKEAESLSEPSFKKTKKLKRKKHRKS